MTQRIKMEFTVPDMDCASCVVAITGAVQRVDPNASVAADLTTKQVLISSSIDAQTITAAIDDAGFSAHPHPG